MIDVTEIFDTLERLNRPKTLIDLMRQLPLDEYAIERAGYRSDIALGKKLEIRAAVIPPYIAEVDRLKAERIAADAAEMETADAEAAAAAQASASVRTVDVARLTSARVPDIILMIREAFDSKDAAYARAMWAHARPELWRRAGQEFHREVQGRNSALSAVTMFDMEMKDLAKQQPDRNALAQRHQQAVEDLERQAIEIAAVVGLDQEVKRALVRGTLSEPLKVPGSLVFGPYWESPQR